MAARHRRPRRSQRDRCQTGRPPRPPAHRSRPDHRCDLPRHRRHPAARLPGDAGRPLSRPKLWCLNLKMAYTPLIINAVQIQTAEVGSKPREGFGGIVAEKETRGGKSTIGAEFAQVMMPSYREPARQYRFRSRPMPRGVPISDDVEAAIK